jgi:ParB-like chromosome segregation protein Spo0J
MAKLHIVYQPVGALKPRPNKPRTHSPKQVQQIAASIDRFGFTNPILVDETNGIIAGHGRVAAAKLIGKTEVPTVRLPDVNGGAKTSRVAA